MSVPRWACSVPPPIRKHYVYVLIDPRSEAVFYVGVSFNPARRLEQHMKPGGSSSFWRCDAIREAGLWPVLAVVAECADRIDALWIERALISEYPGLTNSARVGAVLSVKQHPPDHRRIFGDVKVFDA